MKNMRLAAIFLAFSGIITVFWWWFSLAPNRLLESVFHVNASPWHLPKKVMSEWGGFGSDGVSVWQIKLSDKQNVMDQYCPDGFKRDFKASGAALDDLTYRVLNNKQSMCISEKMDGNTLFKAYLQGSDALVVVIVR